MSSPLPECVKSGDALSLNDEHEAPTNPANIIVIHPGSLNLRIGRASDAGPTVIPHVIARKNKSRNNQIACQEDPYLIPAVKLDKDCGKQLQEAQHVVAGILSAFATDKGIQRQVIPRERLSEHNKRVKAVVLPKGSTTRAWTTVEGRPDVIVGDSVLLLKPTEPYHIRWPMRRGQLNIHRGIAGSLTSVVTDLESIWSYAISELLKVPLKELHRYRAVLIIPDVYNRLHVKSLITLLLRRLGFGSCFVQHEAICATFGAGLSSATVVDVGDQTTSVTCVDEGYAPRCARITHEYGGSDITQLLHYLLKQRSFPYSECKSESRIGGLLLQNLKECFCHLDVSLSGSREKQFQVCIPDQPLLQYNILLGDECLYAPLALFQPELFAVTGLNKKMRILCRNEGDSEDPFDESYLISTKRRYGEAALEANAESATNVDDNEELEGEVTAIANEKEIQVTNRLIGLDKMILQCIDRCDSDEMKRRVISSVLVVGGGFSFPGAQLWLKERLTALLPAHLRNEQPIEVVTKPKDTDNKVVTWKGASVMCMLDSASDLWFDAREWDSGVRVLREKAPFTW